MPMGKPRSSRSRVCRANLPASSRRRNRSTPVVAVAAEGVVGRVVAAVGEGLCRWCAATEEIHQQLDAIGEVEIAVIVDVGGTLTSDAAAIEEIIQSAHGICNIRITDSRDRISPSRICFTSGGNLFDTAAIRLSPTFDDKEQRRGGSKDLKIHGEDSQTVEPICCAYPNNVNQNYSM